MTHTHARVCAREGEREIERAGKKRERERERERGRERLREEERRREGEHRRERNINRVTPRERQGTLHQIQSDMYRHRDRDEETGAVISSLPVKKGASDFQSLCR